VVEAVEHAEKGPRLSSDVRLPGRAVVIDHVGSSRARDGPLRRLPGQDFHLLEQRVFQDAP
jgi:hypothetical protein